MIIAEIIKEDPVSKDRDHKPFTQVLWRDTELQAGEVLICI